MINFIEIIKYHGSCLKFNEKRLIIFAIIINYSFKKKWVLPCVRCLKRERERERERLFGVWPRRRLDA